MVEGSASKPSTPKIRVQISLKSRIGIFVKNKNKRESDSGWSNLLPPLYQYVIRHFDVLHSTVAPIQIFYLFTYRLIQSSKQFPLFEPKQISKNKLKNKNSNDRNKKMKTVSGSSARSFEGAEKPDENFWR